MRRLPLSALCVATLLVFAGRALTAAEPVDYQLHLRVDPAVKVLTDDQQADLRGAFYRQEMVEGYRAHGVHDERWDAKALEYIEQFANDLGRSADGFGENRQRRERGEALAALGCTDPLALYLISSDRNGFADAEQGRTAAAGVYPLLRTQGYPDFVRFRILRKLVFRPDRLASKARTALLADPGSDLVDWLQDPAIVANPWIVTEQLSPLDFQDADPAVNRRFWTAMAAAPEAKDPANRWLVRLGRGIAKAFLSGALDDDHGGPWRVRNAPTDPLDKARLQAAIADLREAQKLKPGDAQAPTWLFRIAAMTASGNQVPRAFEAAMALDPSSAFNLVYYRSWLSRQTNDEPVPYAHLVVALSGLSAYHDSLFQWTTSLICTYLERHPEHADRLLADPRLPRAVETFYREMETDRSHGPPGGFNAEHAATLWRLGRMADARQHAQNVPPERLARKLAQWGGSPDKWAQALAHDPVIAALDAGLAAQKDDPAKAEKLLGEAAKSGQFDTVVPWVDFLATHQRKEEALAVVQRYAADFFAAGDPTWAASTLLDRSATPAEVERAFAPFVKAPHWLIDSAWGPYFFQRVRSASAQSRLAPLLDPAWQQRHDGSPFRGGLNLAEAGRFADALGWFDAALQGDRITRDGLAITLACKTLCARVAHLPEREPTPEALLAEVGHGKYMPAIDPLLRYLAKELTRDAALAQGGPDADELSYYLALDALGRGDTAQARTNFSGIAERHPNWLEAGGCRSLLAWLETNPPLPKVEAKPANF